MSSSIQKHLPSELSAAAREELAQFVTRFIDYPRARLDEVLEQSDYVWLCRDPHGKLVGTTAVRRLEVTVAGRSAIALYTAMVAIDPACRRQGLIARMGFASYLRERAVSPWRPVYWLALAASPSGYLQMARSVGTYYPRHDRETPVEVQSVLEQCLEALGINDVERVAGCLRLPDDFGVSDSSQNPSRWDRSDADVDFFLRVNPGYQRGSDLACLAPLTMVSVLRALLRPSKRSRAAASLQFATV